MKTVGYLPKEEKAKEEKPKDGGSKEAEKKAAKPDNGTAPAAGDKPKADGKKE